MPMVTEFSGVHALSLTLGQRAWEDGHNGFIVDGKWWKESGLEVDVSAGPGQGVPHAVLCNQVFTRSLFALKAGK